MRGCEEVSSLQYPGNILRSPIDGTSHQLRHIVALEQLTMVVGITGRQFEGLGSLSGGVDVSNERTGEYSVTSTG